MNAGRDHWKVVVADDEGPARTRIRQFLKHETDCSLVGDCANGREVLECVARSHPDILFLDVQMPGMGGFEVCDLLREAEPVPCVIFVTAFDRYAVQAFEVHAIDYLLKPFDQMRFRKALERARERLRTKVGPGMEQSVLTMLRDYVTPVKNGGRMIFREGGKLVVVRAEDLKWVESDGNYVKLHTSEGEHHVRETLGHLEAQFSNERFLRISRSVLVNLDFVREFRPLFSGDYAVILREGTKLTLTRTYRDRLTPWITGPGREKE